MVRGQLPADGLLDSGAKINLWLPAKGGSYSLDRIVALVAKEKHTIAGEKRRLFGMKEAGEPLGSTSD